MLFGFLWKSGIICWIFSSTLNQLRQAEIFHTKFCFHSFVGRLWCFSHATTTGLKTQKSKFQSKIKVFIKVAMKYEGSTSNF